MASDLPPEERALVDALAAYRLARRRGASSREAAKPAIDAYRRVFATATEFEVRSRLAHALACERLRRRGHLRDT
jgi:hypothetical protein